MASSEIPGLPAEPLAQARWLEQPSTTVAPLLLGSILRHHSAEGTVAVRLTELEAYRGPRDSQWPDPGSHTFRGRTLRNGPMFGPAGHFYVYFTYGMHYCANIVCSLEGTPSAVLMRAGEVVEGIELARSRRPAAKKDAELAQGPARLVTALGLGKEHNGGWALSGSAPGQSAEPSASRDWCELISAPPLPSDRVGAGPRVGVSGPGGTDEYPWRFWILGDPTVSRYKAAVPRATTKTAPRAIP